MIEALKKWANKATRKTEILQYVVDGSFDRRDKERIKPLTRVREDMSEIEKEREGDINQRVQDWLKDISETK
jgi:hypothetical protein